MSQEINELIDHAVQVAKSTYAGTYIFGGQETAAPPYSAEVDEDGHYSEVNAIFESIQAPRE